MQWWMCPKQKWKKSLIYNENNFVKRVIYIVKREEPYKENPIIPTKIAPLLRKDHFTSRNLKKAIRK